MKNAFQLFIFIGLVVFAVQCSESPTEEINPVILKMGPSGVTIAWVSEKPYKGAVFYKPTGTDAEPSSVREKFAASRRHEVTVTGLQQGTRYTYWPGKSRKRYQFQTQPAVNKPFSFLVVYDDVSQKIAALVKAEVPDFILSLNPVPMVGGQPGRFAGVRAYVPVFAGTKEPGLNRALDWGGLRLIFLDNIEKLPGALDTLAPHTFGIITYPGADKDSVRANALHTALLDHNRKNPTSPASFVWVIGSRDDAVKVDGIQYLGIQVEGSGDSKNNGKAIRIDVDVETTTAIFLDEEKSLVLREPPLKGKRTCAECRRLADKGAYEESIKAYKEFIENNRGHYQIDDAYFAIGEIYDEKLFKFPEAVQWYRLLIKEYPSGNLTPLAGQRLKYLSGYSGHGYQPLARFERIKKIDFSREKERAKERAALLEKAAAIIADYPDSKLAPVIQHWLANRWRQFSAAKAVELYGALKEKYPASAEAEEVSLEIGATYYDAGRYKEALTFYRKALKELPGRKETIAAQIMRAKRNLNRDTLATVSWLTVSILIVLAFLLKPTGFDFSRVGRFIAAFLVPGVILLFGGWLIHEQFSSAKELGLLVGLFAFNAALSSFLSTNFGAKFPGKALKMITGSVMGILFFAAGFYLTIYYVNIHYLVVFKL